jgi:hypothetical protein
LKKRQTAAEIRDKGLVFVTAGSAHWNSLVKQAKNVAKVTLVKQALAVGLIGGLQATVSKLTVPTFLLYGFLRRLTLNGLTYATHQCQSTLGCWPQAPILWGVSVNGTRNACRLPEKAKEGGSPLWFLPPPGLHLKHSKRLCVLEKCKKADMVAQTVGLGISKNSIGRYEGKPNLYNCQLLSFDRMSPQQRVTFVQRLEDSGIEREYDLSIARSYASGEMQFPDRVSIPWSDVSTS